ncbi:SDR family NAD(P)-dependent oxidoreductase [Phyllobacterium sp. SYP-B3895]|uniref:SDR family NAD(P)-dependent oxidoreductase n=1 Tax=Phyllobacterium sp. SYP-B3895 TaxID=2663240 RepID=UPI001299ECCF|nr:SDR family NAD(P)-dependent oxidoreductase [Phyllobacterium sp. SYP-B3895]MRG55129.1 SDR family NAD(P)-dependent oxidoreductase [Phyllobacterium sp. SYP-B3895]
MRVIVLGATSAIAEATARLYALEGADLLLVGRQEGKLEAIAADLKVRGATRVETAVHDLAVSDDVRTRLAELVATLGGVDHVIVAYGILGDQNEAERSTEVAEDILRINFNSAAAWCLAVADLFETQARGSLVVLGSVAGDRGRRANYVYGAAKAGLAALVEGISHRFASNGPRAAIVKPGPTITPMTDGMKRKGALWATPEQVAKVVRRAADDKGPVFYAPARWRLIMLIIRNLPTAIFNRMSI